MFKINIKLDGRLEEIVRVRALLPLIEKAVNSPEFKAFVEATKFTQTLDQPKPEQFLQEAIIKYTVTPRPLRKRFSSVIGYTMYKNQIFTYRNSFNEMSDAELAAHICHEILHTPPFNFTHSVRASKERALSIPYQVGDFVEKYVAGIAQG